MPDLPTALSAVADSGAPAPETTMTSSPAGQVTVEDDAEPSGAPEAPTRKRPKPGERRVQILQTLAAMLEEPGVDRITTVALAAKL